MKSYTIIVDGKSYDVIVEEKGAGYIPTVMPGVPQAPAPAAAPAAGGAGSIKVEAGAAGKVFKLTASEGAKLSKGDEIMVLEVMKMETPVVAPQDGVLKTIEVSEGQTVEAGKLLATMSE